LTKANRNRYAASFDESASNEKPQRLGMRIAMPRTVKKRRGVGANEALLAANTYALFHYPTMFTGAGAYRLVVAERDLWVVPIVLTHPDHGVLGNVGLVAVDASSGEVIGSTPRAEVIAAGRRVREGKGYDVRTTLLPSRAV
jgi:hypothetical protein